jgi:hypothetical protein
VIVTDHEGNPPPCDTPSIRQAEYRVLAAAPPLHREILNALQAQRRLPAQVRTTPPSGSPTLSADGRDGYRHKFPPVPAESSRSQTVAPVASDEGVGHDTTKA